MPGGRHASAAGAHQEGAALLERMPLFCVLAWVDNLRLWGVSVLAVLHLMMRSNSYGFLYACQETVLQCVGG